MKKWIIWAGALSAVLLLLVYCSTVDYTNPLDKKGTNYLFGDTTEEKRKIDDASGVSNIFNPDSNQRWLCDGKAPTFTFVGGSSSAPVAEIKSNENTEFNRLMGKVPNPSAVVTWTENNVSVEIVLTQGGPGTTVFSSDSMPRPSVYPGQYVIVYTAKKPECDNRVPSTTLSRGLVINEYIPPQTGKPSIILVGKAYETVNIGETYTDPGVTVRDVDGTTVIQLTKIEIRDNNGNVISTITESTTQAAITRLGTQLTTQNTRAGTFTVTYHVTGSNDSTNSANRTVEFVSPNPVGFQPIIVLNTYSHTVKGHPRPIAYVDTAYKLDGTYIEKGVKEVYYINREGVKVTIPTSNVTIPSPPPSSPNPAQRSLTYTIPAKAGEYQQASTTRSVYMYYDDCEEEVEPVITFPPGGDALTIPAGQVWNVKTSCSVTRGQGAMDGLTLMTFYVADLDGLDPNAPVARATPYTVTYVALNGCGVKSVKSRQVTVTAP